MGFNLDELFGKDVPANQFPGDISTEDPTSLDNGFGRDYL
jgi:hypothetical protein